MYLGLSCSHNASACVVDADGTVLFSASEERFTRRKGEWGLPRKTLDHIFCEIAPVEDFAGIVVGESCGYSYGSEGLAHVLNLAHFDERDALLQDRWRMLRLGCAEFGGRMLGRRVASRTVLTEALRALGLGCPIQFVDHHTAHADDALRALEQDAFDVLVINDQVYMGQRDAHTSARSMALSQR